MHPILDVPTNMQEWRWSTDRQRRLCAHHEFPLWCGPLPADLDNNARPMASPIWIVLTVLALLALIKWGGL